MLKDGKNTYPIDESFKQDEKDISTLYDEVNDALNNISKSPVTYYSDIDRCIAELHLECAILEHILKDKFSKITKLLNTSSLK